MEKKELRDKVYEIYRRVYKTEEKPGLLELAKLLNALAQAVRMCSDAEEQIGKELCDLIKRCTKVNKRSVNVDITLFANEIGFYEDK